uniref:Uncharacterized protein n=1 Tax=Ciona savignyi TaxID=51511 RepID=H2ZPD7_CIOSA
NNLTLESHNSLSSVGKHEADRKEILTKTTDKKFKPQPPKPLKQKSTPNVCEKPSTKVKKSDVRPPPLPPKKPSIYQKLNNSKTPRKIRPESKEDNKEKVTQVTKPSNGKPPNLNLTKPIKPIMKRPTSLNSNNSNNSDQDLPENMSAQQRLFHQ